ncbi:MAG: M20/M25/M40 family metallo-hydrolase [Planctomycetes bacterium]|nr:M20/M25/M40 family metallo-hydrolase [Planctomycetota bacterium]
MARWFCLRWPAALVPVLLLAAALASAAPPGRGGNGDEPAELVERLVRARGLSGFEGPVREQVAALLPAGLASETDKAGNFIVRIGNGPYRIAFLAHLDELGFTVQGIEPDGRLRVTAVGRFLPSLLQGIPVTVEGDRGPVPGVVVAGAGPAREASELRVDLGTLDAAATRALGVKAGAPVVPEKRLDRLAGRRVAGRSLDDRVGCVALLLALRALAAAPPPADRTVSFVFDVREEIGLQGAQAYLLGERPDLAIAIDTFVSTESPVEDGRLARAALGGGPVFRAIDHSYAAQAEDLGRLQEIAARAGVTLQVGVTAGYNDASAGAYAGVRMLALGWPQRAAHSQAETMELADLEGLARLVAEVARSYGKP